MSTDDGIEKWLRRDEHLEFKRRFKNTEGLKNFAYIFLFLYA